MQKDKQNMDNILYKDLLGQYYNNSIKEEHRQNQLLAPLDINYDTFRCLRYLSEHPDGVEPSVMAKDLFILRQTITYVIDKLEKREFVERLPHPKDRRRILVKLCPKGEELADRANAISMEYHSRITEHFTEQQLTEYITLRNQMTQIRDQVLEEMLQEREEQGN